MIFGLYLLMMLLLVPPVSASLQTELIFSLAAFQQQSQTPILFKFRGFVVDQADNVVPQVDVYVVRRPPVEITKRPNKSEEKVATTDEKGRFTLQLPTGSYFISFRLNGKEMLQEVIEVSTGVTQKKFVLPFTQPGPLPGNDSNQDVNDNKDIDNKNDATPKPGTANHKDGSSGHNRNRVNNTKNEPVNQNQNDRPSGNFPVWIFLVAVAALIVLGLAGAAILAFKIFGEPTGSATQGDPTKQKEIDEKKTEESADPPVVGVGLTEDEVCCTLFAPAEVLPGDHFLVQVFAHLLEQADELTELALELDPVARKNRSITLGKKIKRITELTFKLKVLGYEDWEDEQKLVWRGEPESVEFIIPIPADHGKGIRYGRIFVYQDNEELGKIPFRIQIVDHLTTAEIISKPMPREDFAFVSYASKDKDQVYRFVQLLDGLGYKFHIDIFDIDAGERWEQKLYQFIDNDEVFLLFWSEAASHSEWVIREAKRAEEKAGPERKNRPKIIIYHLNRPPVAVPDWLSDIQYDRKWAEIIGNIQKKSG